jgi:prolyl-tRNA editing enzyme YbaK/EbsC (Cys-tRNA(Pro) deacylase)
MENPLELTVNLEVFQLPSGGIATTAEMAKRADIAEDAVLEATVFRGNGGFISVISPANRRLNLNAVMHELENNWVTYPNDEEWGELGAIDRNNPFGLASDPRVTTFIDALVLKHKEVAFKAMGGRVIKVAMNGLVLGTRAKLVGGISLPKRFL